jgi:hypothetical protein
VVVGLAVYSGCLPLPLPPSGVLGAREYVSRRVLGLNEGQFSLPGSCQSPSIHSFTKCFVKRRAL